MGLVPVTGERVAAAVRRAGAGNPLLGIDIGFSGGVGIDSDIDSRLGTDSGAGGLPAVGLSAGTGPAAALVDAVGAWLGSGERRVAASMVLLGYAARLVGPAVAVLLRDGILLDLRTERVRYSFAPRPRVPAHHHGTRRLHRRPGCPAAPVVRRPHRRASRYGHRCRTPGGASGRRTHVGQRRLRAGRRAACPGPRGQRTAGPVPHRRPGPAGVRTARWQRPVDDDGHGTALHPAQLLPLLPPRRRRHVRRLPTRDLGCWPGWGS